MRTSFFELFPGPDHGGPIVFSGSTMAGTMLILDSVRKRMSNTLSVNSASKINKIALYSQESDSKYHFPAV